MAISELNDEQMLRYSRQIFMPQLDYEGQLKLLNSKALIIGLGGLGSPVALYLAAAGVGTLTLVDFDNVEASNLQRQIIHNESRIGLNKAESAAKAIAELNPEIQTHVISQRLEDNELLNTIQAHDIVIDCSDNFATRFALNDACWQAKKPLISGAVIRMEGQLSVYDPREEDSPCYRCLYKDDSELEATCATNGVLAPVVGIMGSLQATEAIKVLVGTRSPLIGKLLLVDAQSMQFRTLTIPQDSNCTHNH